MNLHPSSCCLCAISSAEFYDQNEHAHSNNVFVNDSDKTVDENMQDMSVTTMPKDNCDKTADTNETKEDNIFLNESCVIGENADTYKPLHDEIMPINNERNSSIEILHITKNCFDHISDCRENNDEIDGEEKTNSLDEDSIRNDHLETKENGSNGEEQLSGKKTFLFPVSPSKRETEVLREMDLAKTNEGEVFDNRGMTEIGGDIQGDNDKVNECNNREESIDENHVGLINGKDINLSEGEMDPVIPQDVNQTAPNMDCETNIDSNIKNEGDTSPNQKEKFSSNFDNGMDIHHNSTTRNSSHESMCSEDVNSFSETSDAQQNNSKPKSKTLPKDQNTTDCILLKYNPIDEDKIETESLSKCILEENNFDSNNFMNENKIESIVEDVNIEKMSCSFQEVEDISNDERKIEQSECQTEMRQDVTLSSEDSKTSTRAINPHQSECIEESTKIYSELRQDFILKVDFEVEKNNSYLPVSISTNLNLEENNNKNIQFLNSSNDTIGNKDNCLEEEFCNKNEINKRDESHLHSITRNDEIERVAIEEMYNTSLKSNYNDYVEINEESDIRTRSYDEEEPTCVTYKNDINHCNDNDIHVAKLCLVEYSDDDITDDENISLIKDNSMVKINHNQNIFRVNSIETALNFNAANQIDSHHSMCCFPYKTNADTQMGNDCARSFHSLPNAGNCYVMSNSLHADVIECNLNKSFPDCEKHEEAQNQMETDVKNLIITSDDIALNAVNDDNAGCIANLNDYNCNNQVIIDLKQIGDNEALKDIDMQNNHSENCNLNENAKETNIEKSIDDIDIILNDSTKPFDSLSAERASGAYCNEQINKTKETNTCLDDNNIENEIGSFSDDFKYITDESKICRVKNNKNDITSEMEELSEGILHDDCQTVSFMEEDGISLKVEKIYDDTKIDVFDSFDKGEKSLQKPFESENISSNGNFMQNDIEKDFPHNCSTESERKPIVIEYTEPISSCDIEGRISCDKQDTNIIEINVRGISSSDSLESSDEFSDSNRETEVEDSKEVFSDDSTTLSNSSDRFSDEETNDIVQKESFCIKDFEFNTEQNYCVENSSIRESRDCSKILSSNRETEEEFSPVENRDSALPTIKEEREDLSLVSLISTETSKNSSDIKLIKLMKPTGHVIEIDDKEECFVEGDEDKGYQLIVGNVVRKIPDFVLYLQDEHVDENEEVGNLSTTHRNHVDDIVMMNDDESFITVVNDVSTIKFDADSTLSDDDSAIEGFVIRQHIEDEDGFSVDTNSLTASLENLSISNESTKFVHRYNDTFKKKLSKVEKRLSTGLSTISLNFFHKVPSDTKKETHPDTKKETHSDMKKEAPSDTSSKGRRPLSGVRKRLSSNRRKVYKIRAAKSLDGEQQQDSDSDGSYLPQPLPPGGGSGAQYLFIDGNNKPKEEDVSIVKLRKCFNKDQLLSKSFGKRAQGGGRRPNECLILEPSEMMVIDYPDVQLLHPGQRSSANPRTYEKLHFALDPRDLSLKGAGSVGCPLNPSSGVSSEGTPIHYHGNPHLQQLNHDLPDLLRGGRSRGSVGSSVRDGSDTSSAYSGSDTMCQSIHSLDHEDVDLSGLMESVVDSDEEDLVENVESMSVQDTVRECLEKDPSDRTESDIKVLLEFTERLSAFANFTVGVRRAMCQAMVFAVVEEADTILMNDGEELDSWSVIINGHVEVTLLDGTVHKLFLGDSFGITPTMEKLYHRGVMRSKVDDCQFVCIRQSDYYRILRQGEENTRRHEEDGVLVLVTEKSHIDTCHREANIVIKGTAERLMLHLVEVENILDTTYVEDFLLTHRKFIENSVIVAKKLLEWFDDPKYQDIVTRVFLRWVQSYFTDFEMDPDMMICLERFEHGLMEKEMTGQLFFLRMVCMTKARSREVTLTRPSRDKPLQFTIVGRKNYGIFISSVEKGSKAEEVGLKRADQILEANGQSFANISRNEALETLKSTCHLAITVRSNLHTFNDMLQTPENAHKGKNRKTSDLSMNGSCQGHLDFVSTLNLNTVVSPQHPHNRKEGKGTSMTLKTHKFKEFLASIVTKSNIIDDSVSSHSSTGGHLYRSRSNPDLSTTEYEENGKSEFPDHVLKVYRATDHSARFLPVHKETTAREVVMLALSLFSIAERSQEYALYEVSATEGPTGNEKNVKQKKLPDGLQNLAERIGLGSRYYLKKVTSSQNQYSDEVVNELLRESQVSLLQLGSVVELAIQLTLEDFAIFRQIEPTEYIDNLFKIKSKYGTPALSKFEQISNRELFWVCTEVCSEHNVHKRAKIVKQFIKIARYCKDLNNFNSMFAILSGLGSTSVNRLRQTWARVPNRYRKIFSDLETVMDPSQNMKNYRKLANTSFSQSPMIPFYPIVKKDLLFLNEGNDDEVDGLINFEKLRTISKSIRKLGEMCSTKYCPNKMLEKLGQPQSTAMTAMNQGITGSQQSSTVKRRKKSTAQPDKKKMFEEAQMVRRVKAYLSQLKVITDEDSLMKMSYECEPPSSSHMSTSTHAGGSSTSSSSISSGQQSGTNSAPPSNPQIRRRHHSPTPSTTSSNSSNSHTSEGKKPHARFGAASPTSERKMLSLAEATKKPYHGPRPPTAANTLSQSSLSPNPSPGALRRGPAPPVPTNASGSTSVRPTHERSHSDIPVNSVDLNAESSSVTSLSSYANLRKSHTSGSMAASVNCHANQGETDSDVPTHFDCHSTSSSMDGSSAAAGGGSSFESHYPNSPPSPHSHHRRLSHQTVSFKPPFPHAVAVLPPIPPEAACGTRFLRRGVSGGPPDYTSTQMRIQHLGRALSHDGVHYYHHSRHEDEEDETQVSAV